MGGGDSQAPSEPLLEPSLLLLSLIFHCFSVRLLDGDVFISFFLCVCESFAMRHRREVGASSKQKQESQQPAVVGFA